MILIENNQPTRDVIDGVEHVTERWVAVGRVTGNNRWNEAHMELARLNGAIVEAVREDEARRLVAARAGLVEGPAPRRPQRSRHM